MSQSQDGHGPAQAENAGSPSTTQSRDLSRNTTLLGIGIAGSLVTALCCFTPLLVILLGAVGAAAWTGYLDYVLIPALVLFVGLTVYALRRRQACRPHETERKEP